MESDLIEIWWHLAHESSPEIADKQLHAINDAATDLREWPLSGRARGELLLGIRSVVVRPYVVFYRAALALFEIVRVLHGRRDVAAIFAKPGQR